MARLRTSIRHVGQLCWLWNHPRRQLVWKTWLQGSFLQREVISSRQMAQRWASWSSSSVASGQLEGERQGEREKERERERGRGHIKASLFDHSYLSLIYYSAHFNQHVHVHSHAALFSSPFTAFHSYKD